MADDKTAATRTSYRDEVSRFKDLMGAARDSRSEGNAAAGEARAIFQSLGFSAAAIAIFKRLSDMDKDVAEATFSELCELLEADPDFDFGNAQPDMFAARAVKEAKAYDAGSKRKSNKPHDLIVAVADAMQHARAHLGTDDDHDDDFEAPTPAPA